MEARVNLSEWLNVRGAQLWSLVHFGSVGSEEFRDEFMDVLASQGRRLRQTLAKSPRNQAYELGTQTFLKEWLKRQGRRRGVDQDDLDWELRILLCAVYVLGWDLDETARSLGLTGGAARFRTLQAVKRFARYDAAAFRTRGRDCVRHDLFFVDLSVGSPWADPAGVTRPREILAHRADCERCAAVTKFFDGAIANLRAVKLHAPAGETLQALEQENESSGGVGEFLRGWKWPVLVRVPVRVALAVALALAVLSVPFGGDVYRGADRAWREWLSSSARPPLVVRAPVPTNSATNSLVAPPAPPPTPVATTAATPVTTTVAIAPSPSASNPTAPTAASPRGAPSVVATNSEPFFELPSPPLQRQVRPSAAPVVSAPVVAAARKATEEKFFELPSPPMVRQPKRATPVATAPKVPATVTPSVATTVPSTVAPKTEPTTASTVASNVGRTPPAESAPAANSAAKLSAATAGKSDVSTSAPALAPATSAAPAVPVATATGSVRTRVFYRWGAFSNALESDNDKLVTILRKYGARKSGELDLGADYRGGKYFHFSLPDENYAAMLGEIQALNLTDFTNTRAESDRLSPAGEHRVVFLVRPR